MRSSATLHKSSLTQAPPLLPPAAIGSCTRDQSGTVRAADASSGKAVLAETSRPAESSSPRPAQSSKFRVLVAVACCLISEKMERSVLAVAFAVFLMAVFLVPASSLPTNHVDDIEGKMMDTEKRPKYMDTRDEIKNLIYGTVVGLVAEGKLSPAILPSQDDSDLEKPKEKRYMRICFTKMANHFVPYPCNGRK